MKKIVAIILFSGLQIISFGQKTALPLSVHSNADTTKPLIFYVSGDGGFNKFSTSFMQTLNKEGYTVIGLNAKEYFWSKKDPQETAIAVETAINDLNKQWTKKKIALIGYSFGADVTPFLFTHFSAAFAARIERLILLSPSSTTDFEIHVLQMFGWGKNSGKSVPAEINKIGKPVVIIVGDDENEFPFNALTIKNKEIIKMPGGHHYDGDLNNLCNKINSQMK